MFGDIFDNIKFSVNAEFFTQEKHYLQRVSPISLKIIYFQLEINLNELINYSPSTRNI